jgi:hypothetical protein
MKEKPIIFSTPMVQAILSGQKKQTRRAVKGDLVARFDIDGDGFAAYQDQNGDFWGAHEFCPYGRIGNRLWVREAFSPNYSDDGATAYKADYDKDKIGDVVTEPKWCSPLYMRRAVSRITLEITGIRIEGLTKITQEDAIAEGCSSVEEYRQLWDRLNGKKKGCSWVDSPWVWKIEFKRLKVEGE